MTASSRPDWLAIGVFAVASVALSWLVALPLWLRGLGLADPFLGVFAAAMMFTPSLGVVAALLVQRRTRGRRGARVVLRDLGMWPLRPAARTIWTSVAVIVAAPLLIALGLVVVGALGLATFDPIGFSGFARTIEAAVPEGTTLPPIALLTAIQLAAIPIGAVINAPFAFGEELGWRGFLLPALRPLGVWPALVVSGAFWGFWHAPLMLLGYNFLEPNAFGVLMMIVACMFFGVLLGWTRLRTASVWPAVFAHGAFNASAGLGALVIAADSATPSPVIAGPLGVIMWGVFAAVIGILAVTGQFRSDRLNARLGPDPARTDAVPSATSA